MITLTELDNGDLRIALDPEIADAEQQLRELLDKAEGGYPLYSIAMLTDALDDSGYLGNGWEVYSAEDFGQLSQCHVITYMLNEPEDFFPDDEHYYNLNWAEKAWYYADYAITCPIEAILEDGEVIFTRVRDE
jgi:hypothetical protein